MPGTEPQNHETNWAEVWIAIGTWALVIATAALFWATFRLYRTTINAIETAAEDAEEARRQARELFEAERRPWIKMAPKMKGAETKFYAEKIGGAVAFDFDLENAGLSPAFDVFVQNYATFTRYYDADKTATRAEMERVRHAPAGNGFAMYPTDRRTEFRQFTFDLPAMPGDAQILYFVGWVGYRFGMGRELHFTPYVLEVKWRTTNDEERKPRSGMGMNERYDFRLPPD